MRWILIAARANFDGGIARRTVRLSIHGTVVSAETPATRRQGDIIAQIESE